MFGYGFREFFLQIVNQPELYMMKLRTCYKLRMRFGLVQLLSKAYKVMPIAPVGCFRIVDALTTHSFLGQLGLQTSSLKTVHKTLYESLNRITICLFPHI